MTRGRCLVGVNTRHKGGGHRPAHLAAPRRTLTPTLALPLHRHRSPLTAHLSPFTLTLPLTLTLTKAVDGEYDVLSSGKCTLALTLAPSP